MRSAQKDMSSSANHHFLIVPAWSDQAGQCRIVHRATPAHVSLGLNDYRNQPNLWMEVGIMASDGHVVCLDAWPEVWQEMKDSEPLMASTIFSYEASENDIASALLGRLQTSPRTQKDIDQCIAHLRMFCPNHFASTDRAREWLSNIGRDGLAIVEPNFAGVFNDVVEGLKEFHPALRSEEVQTVVKTMVATSFKLTGNTQADYERMRNEIEAIAEQILEVPAGPRP